MKVPGGEVLDIPINQPGRLLDVAGPAPWNMALDEALLMEATGAPVLRFYNWQSPAVTLGRFQDVSASLDLEFCQSRGIPVVRRPTGGRAVYHEHDLTYMLLIPETALPEHSVQGSYRAIMAAFIQGLRTVDLAVALGTESGPGRHSRADCFLHAATADLTLKGQKIIGSAQVRREGWILQQGSIRLWGASPPPELFRTGPPAPTADYSVSRNEVASALALALADLLGCEWNETVPTAPEEERAGCLVQRKYGTPEWNINGKEE